MHGYTVRPIVLEREVFEAYLSLPVPQRKIVREVIQTFAKAFPVERSKPD